MSRDFRRCGAAAALCFLLACVAGTATAQEDESTDGWDGTAEFSLANASGNSDTLTVGLASEAKNIVGRYTHLVSAGFNYGETDGAKTQDNLLLSYQLDIQLRDRTYGYGRVQYDRDEFSGFENRVFLGGGLGHYLVENEATSWKVEGGPGFRYSELEAPDPPPAGFETTETEFAVYASSEFGHLIREGIRFTHSLDTVYTQSNSSVKTVAALSSKLTETLSSKLSYEVRYETDPPAGKEDTDTLLKASIVYGF